MIFFRSFLLLATLFVFGCGDVDRNRANDSLNDSVADKTPPHKLDSLSIRRYAGVYAFGNDAEKDAVGTLWMYPETDSTVIYHLDISNGPPAYSSGIHTGSVKIENDTAAEWFALDTVGTECKLRFRFTPTAVTIQTVPGFYGCGFGHGVTADHTYKRITDTIPEFYIDGIGDTCRFDRIIWWNREVRLTGKMPLDYDQDSITPEKKAPK